MSRLRVFCLVALGLPIAYAAVDEDGFVRIKPSEIVFEVGNPGGPEIALLAGDPEKEGFYLLRARFAPGVFSSPHYHSSDRNVTVIQDTWYAGGGEDCDRDNEVPLGEGSEMKKPDGRNHQGGAKGKGVIVEIKGIGPATTMRLPR